jgi:hypothetical protein
VNVCLMDCIAVWTCTYIPTFRRNILLPPSGIVLANLWYLPLPTKSHGFTTQNTNIDRHLNLRENLKSHSGSNLNRLGSYDILPSESSITNESYFNYYQADAPLASVSSAFLLINVLNG